VLLATEPQQHDFNLPYQISHPTLFPDTDVAESADRHSLDVRAGDVVVAASDGLWDNMWDEQVLQLLGSCGLGGCAPAPAAAGAAAAAAAPSAVAGLCASGAAQQAAQLIAQRAYANSHDNNMKTPWAAAVGKHAGLLARLFARGGKQDDITVVVGIVC
jgi:hypothetical protein